MILISATGGGTTHPDILSSVIGSVARNQDNCAKLRRAQAAERHLFVWIEEIAHQVAAAVEAMRDLGITPSPVDLPEEVDVVWIAKARDAPSGLDEDLWQFDRSHGWRRIR